MANYQKIKGTQDFWGEEISKIRYVENIMRKQIEKAGFFEIKTPIFEYTEVFSRSVGDESDIVAKEMYTFLDRGGRSITLRPEGTAALVRSYVENKIYTNPGVNKFYYCGPMFRYERPQAGRYREFNQFGVEAIGLSEPLLDAEVILSAYNIINSLGIKNVKLKINSIGDLASRETYKLALTTYFAPFVEDLCSDCGRRYTKNILRILDCKIDAASQAITEAPKIKDFLNQESRTRFAAVCAYLDALDIKYEVDLNLVRGLDYYTDTVFEFIIESDDELNKLAVCAGGVYSGLVQELGGPNSPGVGYAFGLERIVKVGNVQNLWGNLESKVTAFIISLDQESRLVALTIARKLRAAGYYCEMDYSSTQLKKQFNSAQRLNPRFILIIGEAERENKTITLKNNETKEQITIEQDNLLAWMKENNEDADTQK